MPFAVALLMLATILFPLIHVTPASALTATLVPDTDVTAGWTVLGGVSDGTCSGGTHCDYVDEGATPNDADYVSTGTALAAVTEEFGLTTLTNVANVSKIIVTVRANTITIGGGTADTISINLRVGGTLQTASVQTPTNGSYTNLMATFTGSFTQAQLDGMQIQAVRNVLGGGAPANQDDDVRISNMNASVTYVGNFTAEQSGYRFFENDLASGNITFAKAYGAAGTDAARVMTATSDGGYAVAGQTTSFGAGSDDVILTRYDSTGNILFTRIWGGTGSDVAYGVTSASDGSIVITGSTASFGVAVNDVFLIKYDANGTLQFSRTWGGADNDTGTSVITIADGSIIMTGFTGSFGGALEMFLIKYNSTGTLQFSRTWGGATSDAGRSVIATSDGGFMVTGDTLSFGTGLSDMFLVKYDSAGTVIFSRTWGGASDDFGHVVVQTPDGGYAVTGYTASFGAGADDAFLAKYDSAGNLSFSRTWGGTGIDVSFYLASASDGSLAMTGYTASFGAGSNDMFLIKYDAAGTLLFSRTWGGINSETGRGLLATADGGYAVTGTTTTFGAGGFDMILVKYDSTGNIAGCTAQCATPTPIVGSPTATVSTPTPTIGSPTATLGTPTPTTSSPLLTTTVVVAVAPGVNVGLPLAATNVAALAPAEGTPFRLRMNLHIGTTGADVGDATYKLQYAARGTDNLCDTGFLNETYSDVGTTSSVINYFNNPNLGDGQPLITNANDPTHVADTLVRQSYEESNNFTISNIIAAGQDGMWDFALVDAGAPASTPYCFRAVTSAGSVINSYTVVPEITTASPILEQSAYRSFKNKDKVASSFIKSLGGTGGDYGNSLVQTSDGGYAVTGFTTSFGAGVNDMFISKYDSAGTLIFSRTWGGAASEEGYSIIQTSDGGYAVTGYTASYGTGGSMFLAKYDSAGTLIFSRIWGGTNDDRGSSLVQTGDGGYAITGRSNSFSAGSDDMFLAKYDSAGTLIFSRTWGGVGLDRGASIVNTVDGGYAITGYTDSFGAGLTDMFLTKYDSSGTLSFSRTWGGTGSEFSNSLVHTSDGGYAITGYTDSFGAGVNDIFLTKYDSAGNLSFSRTWGGLNNEYGQSLIQSSDGGYAITGNTVSFGSGGGDMFLTKYDSAGNLSFSRTWGGSGAENFTSIVQSSDGGYAITGNTTSYGAGGNDLFIAKYNSSGEIGNCGTNCKTVTATVSTPTASTNSPVATTASPSVTVSLPIVSVSTPGFTDNIIAGSNTFTSIWGNSSAEQGFSTVQTSDGGYAVTGNTGSSGLGDMFIARYDSSGSRIWQRTWGVGGAQDQGNSIVQTSDGGFAVTGLTESYGAGLSDMFFAKYDSSGTLSYSRIWGGTSQDHGASLVPTSDGGYAITGYTSSFGNGNPDMFLVKYDSLGTLSFSRTWGGTNLDEGKSIVQTTDGGYAITGYSESFTAVGNDMFLAKYDSAGTLSFSRAWSSSSNLVIDTGRSIFQTADGGYIISGSTETGFSAGDGDMFLTKYDSAGTNTWSRTWGGTGGDIGYSVVQTSDGGYAVTGSTTSYSAGGKDMFLAKYDSAGTNTWSRTWGGTLDEVGRSIVQSSDGGYTVSGQTLSYGAGAVLLAKYDSIGEISNCGALCGRTTAMVSNITAPVSSPTAAVTTPTPTVSSPVAATTSPNPVITFISPMVFTGPIIPGLTLAATNTAAELPTTTSNVRLRVGLHASGKSLTTTSVLKLQYALSDGVCDGAFGGESYQDVTASSTPIQYFNNPGTIAGDMITATADDPVHTGHANVLQSYVEANNFSPLQQVPVGSDGLWDFSLKLTGAQATNSYCFRIVTSAGSTLATYTAIPEVFIPPNLTKVLRHGRFFNSENTLQPFAW